MTAVSLALGVSFRAGRFWEGVGEYKERLQTLEEQHRELAVRFHQFRVELAQGEYPDLEMDETGEAGEPYVAQGEELETEEER